MQKGLCESYLCFITPLCYELNKYSDIGLCFSVYYLQHFTPKQWYKKTNYIILSHYVVIVEFKYTDGGEPCFHAEMAGLFNSMEQFICKDQQRWGEGWAEMVPAFSHVVSWSLT